MASITKVIALKSKAACNRAVSCSEDANIAVLRSDNVMILGFGSKLGDKDNPLFMTKSHIPCLKAAPEELPVSQDEILCNIKNDDWSELILNPELNTEYLSNTTQPVIKVAQWSPMGSDTVGRCILAVATSSGSIPIYSRNNTYNDWAEVVDIGYLWKTELQKQKRLQNISHPKLIDTIKHMRNMLTPIALTWSPVLSSSGKGKKSTSYNYTLLIIGLKSGHIGIWKIPLPLTSQSNVELLEIREVASEEMCSVKWCQLQNSKAFLACGFLSGGIQIVNIEVHGDNISISDTSTTVWEEKDKLSVNNLSWCQKTQHLVASKGTFFMAFKWNSGSKDKNCFEVSFLNTATLLEIHGLQVINGIAYLVSGESRLFTVDLNCHPLALKECKVSPLGRRSNIQQWHNHGLCVTPNGAYTVVVDSPGCVFDHLTDRTPLKTCLIASSSPEALLQQLLTDTAPLNQSTDLLCHTTCLFWTGDGSFQSLPSDLRQLLEKDLTKEMNTMTPRQLKLYRYLKQSRISIMAQRPLTTPDEQERDPQAIYIAQEAIIVHHIVECLKSLESSSLQSQQSTTASFSLSLMKQCLEKQNYCKEESSKLLNKIKIRGSEEESCRICQSPVPFTNTRLDGCPNGHKFERCCQTLLLCQGRFHRKCSFCSAVAWPLLIEDEWLSVIQSNICTLCDHPITEV